MIHKTVTKSLERSIQRFSMLVIFLSFFSRMVDVFGFHRNKTNRIDIDR